MIRTALMMFSLALSTTACLDVEDDSKRVVTSEDEGLDDQEDSEEPPIGCRAQIQGSEDPDCNPKDGE